MKKIALLLLLMTVLLMVFENLRGTEQIKDIAPSGIFKGTNEGNAQITVSYNGFNAVEEVQVYL